jgi:hypothetical protein
MPEGPPNHPKLPLWLLLLGDCLSSPSLSYAYCRTTTCAQQNPPEECIPGELHGTCQMAGRPLYWSKPCVSFSVQNDGSQRLGISATQFEQVVRSSFDNWQNASTTRAAQTGISVPMRKKCNYANSDGREREIEHRQLQAHPAALGWNQIG